MKAKVYGRMARQDAKYLRNLMRRHGITVELQHHSDGTTTVREVDDEPRRES